MNQCLNCGKEVKNKYCGASCQNQHQNINNANKRYGEFKFFTVSCNSCNKELQVNEREKLYPQKEKYFCSRSCANKREHSEETKEKISLTLTGGIKKTPKVKSIKILDIPKNCIFCGKSFCSKVRKQKLCSRSCSTRYKNITLGQASVAGKKSAEVQGEIRRSKNEKYFAELCSSYFKKVETNKSIFNGWDADVIIHDLKIAVLWNGNWHYKKIAKKHSLAQVQNRDKIKQEEIKKFGYKTYIIKDLGKYNRSFVEEKFEEFKKENPLN